MYDRHYTDEELLLELFDSQPAGGHLQNCPECAARYEAARRRYENRPALHSQVSEERLALQRLAVRERLEQGGRKLVRFLVPSLAGLAMLAAIALVAFKSIAPRQPAPESVLEDAVFEEVFQMSWSTEPEAIAPVQSLFEEQQ